MKVSVLFRNVFIVSLFILLLGLVNVSLAQFTVVSTIPTQGATQVDTSVTIVMTFSAPLDTSARFPYPDDFFVNLLLLPDTLVGEPDSITMSPDLKTLYVHNLHLTPNITYFFVIVNAVSQAGDSLDMPYSIIFTTGSSLPTGSVSGTVSYPGNDPTGTMVVLFDGNPFESEESYAGNGTVVPGSNGNYTIDYVKAGTYWPAAIKDFYINREGELELAPGTALGFFDFNGDSRADSIIVAPGASVNNVNISLATVYLRTARGAFPQVSSLAQNWASDAIPVMLGADVYDSTGYSTFWWYSFYSPSLSTYRDWFVAGDFISWTKPSEVTGDTIALPQNWLDSDTILSITEANGGSDFRHNNPRTWIGCFLGTIGFQHKGQEKNTGVLWERSSFTFQRITRPVLSLRRGERNTGFPVWSVEYESDETGESLHFFLDSETGEILNTPSTAREAEQNASTFIQAWANDAQLYMVAGNWYSVDPQGKTPWWNCIYYSSQLDSFHVVYVFGKLPLFHESLQWIPGDTLLLPSGWINSDTAIAVAENAGGAAYRQTYPDAFVEAYLSRWAWGPQPDKSVWKFMYTSGSPDTLEILVDALTGTLVSGIADQTPGLLPDHYALYQNYPNPFNPETQIRFRIPQAQKVELVVYTTLGQKVATLVDKRLPAGEYRVSWKPENLSSGFYLISLKAGDFRAVRKMLYLK